jgi:hypothetical protein
MRLILCCLCNEPYSLYAQHNRDGRDYLHWSPVLNEYIHPSCLDAWVYQHEQITKVDMSPLMRLIDRKPTETSNE